MAIFKILKGDSSRISKDVTPFHDGHAYFTPDDAGFYIDSLDDGVENRIRINPPAEDVPVQDTEPTDAETGDLWIDTSDGADMGDYISSPDTAAEGQVLTYKDGKWMAEDLDIPEVNYPVTSVNGQTGEVTLSAADVGARPDTWLPTKAGIGLGNVDNVKQYSANNPPPYPVTSVNGQTGDVVTATQYTATIPSEGWILTAFDYMVKDVYVPGLVGDYSIPPDIDVVLSLNDLDADKELIAAFGLISAAITGTDRLSVYCAGSAPSINIPIVLRVWE